MKFVVRTYSPLGRTVVISTRIKEQIIVRIYSRNVKSAQERVLATVNVCWVEGDESC